MKYSCITRREGSNLSLILEMATKPGTIPVVKLDDLQVVGNELALKWDDGNEQFIELKQLRKACPCAPCAGEIDVLGQMHKGPDQVLKESSYQVKHMQLVGGYAVQIFWADGHSTGLYSFDFLQQIQL